MSDITFSTISTTISSLSNDVKLDIITFANEQIRLMSDQFVKDIDKFNLEHFNTVQVPAIAKSIANFVNGKHTILIAPTGSGKSLIALCYSTIVTHICRKYLSDGNKYNTSILASDTFLQKQYNESINFFFANDIKEYSQLKGKGKYTCEQVMLPYDQGVCADRGINPESAINTLDCAKTCGYVNDYMQAMTSKVRVFNYHLWLSYVNFVGTHHKLMHNEQALVLDECHKLPDIVNDFAQMSITLMPLKRLQAFSVALDLLCPAVKPQYDLALEQISQLYVNMYKSVMTGDTFANMYDNHVKLSKAIGDVWYDELEDLFDHVMSSLQGPISKAPASTRSLAEARSLCMYFNERTLLLSDSNNVNDYAYNYDANNKSISVSNIDTASTAKRYIWMHTKHPSMLMSATIANAQYYAKHIGFEHNEYDIIRIEELFDFSKSPIVQIHPAVSISHANREQNLPTLITHIDYILDNHDEHRGVIHTGNKFIANAILSTSKHSHRMLTYENSAQKQQVLEQLAASKNGVVLAYSMTEGVDLKDDLARFQIIAKISWPYIGDAIVKRKMDKEPEWYSMTALDALVQTFGRGNRHKHDWCYNYILDSSFGRLVHSLDDVHKSRVTQQFYNDNNKRWLE